MGNHMKGQKKSSKFVIFVIWNCLTPQGMLKWN